MLNEYLISISLIIKGIIESSEAIAFGNDENDIDMLELVGLGVAMGNGNEKLKMSANFVTKKSGEDGIEFALKEYEGQDQLITEVIDEVPFQYSKETVTDLENNIQISKREIEELAKECELDIEETINLKALLLNLKVSSYINGHYEMYVKDNTLSSKRS